MSARERRLVVGGPLEVAVALLDFHAALGRSTLGDVRDAVEYAEAVMGDAVPRRVLRVVGVAREGGPVDPLAEVG